MRRRLRIRPNPPGNLANIQGKGVQSPHHLFSKGLVDRAVFGDAALTGPDLCRDLNPPVAFARAVITRMARMQMALIHDDKVAGRECNLKFCANFVF